MHREEQDAEEKAPLSAVEMVESDSEEQEQTVKNYAESYAAYTCVCNANIYNAFIISNYRDPEQLKLKQHKFVRSDMLYGLGFLAYLTAAIQWIALSTMIYAFVDKSDVADVFTRSPADDWSYLPSDYTPVFLWPFFVIGLLSTYKQLAQIWVDIHILEEWKINGSMFHVVILKYFSELILYTVGSFLFYVTLSWYSRNVDYLDVILKLLAYQYIFMADECAYLLVKDIVRRRLAVEHCNTLFHGTRKGTITRYEMVIAITIPLSVSLIIQGIFARTLITLGLGLLSTVIWTLDWCAHKCGKAVIYH
eukprot:87835_1